jgi:hypothetical protein
VIVVPSTTIGAQCLIRRRLVERGVRAVQQFNVGSNNNWDNDISLHEKFSRKVDRPIAALIKDLRQRGLLDETLLVGCSAFGRMRWEDLTPQGRGHYNYNVTCFLAGGGVQRGNSYGVLDECGAKAVKRPMHVHNLQPRFCT